MGTHDIDDLLNSIGTIQRATVPDGLHESILNRIQQESLFDKRKYLVAASLIGFTLMNLGGLLLSNTETNTSTVASNENADAYEYAMVATTDFYTYTDLNK
ncbi:MAG: hypothetical protein U0V72_00515 [Cytophagales bacterium]